MFGNVYHVSQNLLYFAILRYRKHITIMTQSKLWKAAFEIFAIFIVPFTLHFMTQFKADFRDITSSFTASYQYCHIIFWLLPSSSFFMVITWQLSHSHFFFSSRYWKKISLSNFGCSNWLSISLELGTQLKWFYSCWSDQGQMAETYYAIE